MARLLRHRHTGRMGKLITSSDNKVSERIFWVEENPPPWFPWRLNPSPWCPEGQLFLGRSCFLTHDKGHRQGFTRTGCRHSFSQKGSVMRIQPLPKEFIRYSNIHSGILDPIELHW